MRPKVLRYEVSFVAVAVTVYSKRNEAIQGKSRHRHFEDLTAGTGSQPVIAPKGERHACRVCRGDQVGWVVQHVADIGHGPRKDVCAIIITADKHALQRQGVLRPMGVSRNIRYKFL